VDQGDFGSELGEKKRLFPSRCRRPRSRRLPGLCKKAASQTAQADTPLPISRFSEGMPSHLAVAPVEMMMASASSVFPLAVVTV